MLEGILTLDADNAFLSADLRRWLAGHLPDVAAITDASWPRAQSRVWRLATETPARAAYLKVSPSQHSYTCETRAYQQAATALGQGQAPRLIAADPALRAVLVTALPGTVVRSLQLTAATETHVHRLAGRLLRRWHDHLAPAPPQAPDTVRAALAGQAREAAACLDSLSGNLTGAEQDLVRAAARELPALADLPLVYTHGDFSPRNWVWDPKRRTLGLIDFESAAHAPAVQDLVWLFGAMWPTRPDLRESFLAGYGRALTADEHQALRLLTTRSAVSYLAEGITQKDPVLIDRGHTALGHLARAHA